MSRKQAKELPFVRYNLLNLRSINPEGYIDLSETDVFNSTESLSAEYLTQSGDIVVRLTAPYTAVLIDESTEGLVVSSNFLIIRVDHHYLLPEYLFWLLNTPDIRREIYENTGSNMLGAVKARFFSEHEIVLLPLVDQAQIAALHAAAIKEARLLRQLADAKSKYYSMLIEHVHNEMKRGNRS